MPYIMFTRIHLHCHSNISNGLNTPANLIDILVKNGLGIVSLTNHDSIACIEEAKICCINKGITLIPGIEFSASLADSSLSFATKNTVCTFWLTVLIL